MPESLRAAVPAVVVALSLAVPAMAPSGAAAQAGSPAEELVARSIRYHDPGGAWGRRVIRLRWDSSRPGGERREARVLIDNAAGVFELDMELRGARLEQRVTEAGNVVRVDGAADVPDDVRRRLRLDREGGLYWRNYFLFLVGMPMKLDDPSARIRPEPERTTFDGAEVLAVRVRYEPSSGYDSWVFYFDPDTAALVGCRFYHEGPDADGEYIVMEGLAEDDGLRLPAVRRWYTNAGDEHLGTDEVAVLEVGPR